MDRQGDGGRFRRGLFVAAGSLALALAGLGLVLPLLPTTPFLLLATWCYLRGSERLHRWLVNHRVFGRYLRNYQDRQITSSHRMRTLAVLWLGIVASMALTDKWVVRSILIAIAVGVTVHLCRLRTVDHDDVPATPVRSSTDTDAAITDAG